ncbi:MAG: restriction endonuclease subunit S [bacterium]|nr:restriction endonuclease subunit S [bacterium]
MAYDVTKIFQGAPMVKLGELIELTFCTNSKNEFHAEDVMGMTITKEIIPTKANVGGTDLSKFLIVYPDEFVYNPRTHGKKIGLGFNSTDKPFIISWNNVSFKIIDKCRLNPYYLYLHLSRSEWDRSATFRSWGSSTEVFSWKEFCLMEIPLPAIEVQREYVAAYRSLQQLAEQNEALAAPLQDACNAFLAKISAQYECALIGDLITEYSEKNTNNRIKIVKSVSVTKEFNDTNAKVNKNELSGYKIVPPLYISYVQTTKNEKCFASAINKYGYPIVVTSVNRVITSSNLEILDNEYLAMWFRTPEFSRWAIYNSWGSAREVFDFSDLCLSKIPLPPIEVQRSIVALYNCAEEARAIAKEAREQLKILAPAMVQRAANTPVEV